MALYLAVKRGALRRLLVSLLLAHAPGAAWAQTPGDVDPKSHFARGVELFDEGAFSEAVVEFERAYAISGNPRVLFNIGQAYARVGRVVEAHDALSRFLRDAPASEPDARRKAVAEDLARLSSRIGKLTLRTSPDGATVRIDGAVIGTSPLASPIKLAVGEHTVVVSRPGFRPSEARFSLAGQESRSLDLALEPEPSPLQSAQLQVDCPLLDVELSIDGLAHSRTPLTAAVLVAPGRHRVSFSRPGYDGNALAIDVAPNQSVTATCRLTRQTPLPAGTFARLKVDVSEPMARATLDGERVELDEAVPLGRHRLEVTRDGFEPHVAIIDVTPSAQPLTIKLRPTPAFLHDHVDRARSRRTWALATGLAGVAAAGATAGIFLWNDSRHASWKDEQASIDSLVATQKPPFPADLPSRQQQNNQLIRSIHTVDTVNWAVGIGAGALVATGVLLYLTGDDPDRYAEPRGARLDLARMRVTW